MVEYFYCNCSLKFVKNIKPARNKGMTIVKILSLFSSEFLYFNLTIAIRIIDITNNIGIPHIPEYKKNRRKSNIS